MAFFTLSSKNSAPTVVHYDAGLESERISLRLSNEPGSLCMTRDEATKLLADLSAALSPAVVLQAAE